MIESLEKKIRELENVIRVLDKYNLDITEVEELLSRTKSELSLSKERLEKIQKTCSHQFHYDGHDSHYNYYKCDKCEYIEER